MKIINAVLVTLAYLVGSIAFAGGAGGNGGPPAKEADKGLDRIESPLTNGNSVEWDSRLTAIALPNELVSNIPADLLFKGRDGKLLIPLSQDSIRRLKLRASVSGSTSLTLDNGEKFELQRDLVKDSLVDLKKSAEVVEKAVVEGLVE